MRRVVSVFMLGIAPLLGCAVEPSLPSLRLSGRAAFDLERRHSSRWSVRCALVFRFDRGVRRGLRLDSRPGALVPGPDGSWPRSCGSDLLCDWQARQRVRSLHELGVGP